jgi:(p)ppGpp synthase/HD superfamily hydrolase
MSDDIVSRAKALAHRAHAGQVDKAGRPYIEHVARVAAAVSDDPVAESVAWLHDVFEDSPDFVVANEREFFSFPDEVMKSVVAVTRTGHDLESDAFYYICIRMDALALRVKLADIADNSSEERLALLDEKTAARLRRKYAKAIAALTGGQ